jgi:hypothetical protein
MKDAKQIKLRIIAAGYKAVEELIKVAEEDVIKPALGDEGEELAADR